MARIEQVTQPKKGPAKYRIRVFNGSDPRTGRKIVHTETVVGLEAAKDRAVELEADRKAGTLVAPCKEALATYLVRWLEDEKLGRIRARTYDDYRGIIERYVGDPPKGAPRIGGIRVDKLKRQDFKRLYKFLWSDLGLSPRTIQYLHSILRQALSWAVEVGELGRNPTDKATLYKQEQEGEEEVPDDTEGEVKYTAMSEEEAGRFLEAARGDRYFPLWALLITSGVRPGEALGLLWRDADLEAGTVHIRRALTRRGLEKGKGRAWKLEKPKTKRGIRKVTLAPVVVQALKEWRSTTGRERLQAGAEYEDKGFVFCSPFGKPLDQGNLYGRNFRRVMEAAKLGTWKEPAPGRRKPIFLPGFRMYDLRHTAATLLLKKGIHVKIVSEMLGHSEISLTLNTYSHVLPGMQSGAAEAMEAVFGGA
ncbi:MAG: tyrosine-type recombinase/integrase [Candidatus Bipolaricaulota bacterium]